jgi:hypothetical protein
LLKCRYREEADLAPRRPPPAGKRGKRDFDGYICNLGRKNPNAMLKLLGVILDLENKELGRRLRREAALAGARHRRGSG